MHCILLTCIGFLASDVAQYERTLGAKSLDQATLDVEGYGQKSGLKREDSGLRIQLAPGEPETGWKTPQALRIGGDFTIVANLDLEKLPKPAQEDGVAVGISIATQNLDQPDLTLVRVTEMNESAVYRAINQANNGQQAPQQMQMQMQMQMRMQQPGGKPPKPPRPTFPAKGKTVRLELRRLGPSLEYQVTDADSEQPRYLGQIPLGANDIVGVKLFALNRNGSEALDVVFRDLSIQAARIAGLGTTVRSVFGEVVYGEPIAIEDGKLLVGATGGPAQAAAASESPPGSPQRPPSELVSSAPGAQRVVVAAAILAPAAPARAVVVAQAAPAVKMVAVQPAAVQPAAAQPVSPITIVAAQEVPPVGMPAGTAAFANSNGPASPAPKARMPLAELDSIVFDRAVNLSGRYVDQPNVDVTMPGGEKAKLSASASKPSEKADDVLAPPPGTAAAVQIPKVDPAPSGIRDLHFTLSGLRNVEIKQVTITCQTDAGATSWRLDTTGSHDWPLVVQRAGTEPWADLFLEPPAGDAHQKSFTVNLMYADGQNGNANIQVGEHTDPKLAFDAKAPLNKPEGRVFLTGDEQLFAKIEGLDDKSLRLTTPWNDHLEVPLARVAGIYMGLSDHKESPESFARRLKTRGAEDLLLAHPKEGEVVAIGGVVEGTDADKLLFSYQGKTRTLPLKQVEGVVFAARPEPKITDELRARVTLSGGIVLSGDWTGIDSNKWKLRTPWGEDLNLPAGEVMSVRFLGGEVTYLSDLEPSAVEETAYFGRRSPWRRDVNLVGEPLKIDGITYANGLAVHARCVLTYAIAGKYAWFETLVGFDDAARGRGRVECRIIADGKELYANPDLRADAPVVRLALPVAGVERLQLVVDFGADQDTGDRVIWANLRLFRRNPPSLPPDRSKTDDQATPK